MRILDAQVDWMENWCSYPMIKLLVDEIPDLENLRYERRGNLYFAELDNYVSFFYYEKPDQGYGGRHFDLIMKDGSSKTLIGPWSSRSSVMNDAGFTPCTEVSITDDPNVWARGHTFYSGAVTVKLLKTAMHFCNKYPSWFNLHEHKEAPIELVKAYNSSKEIIYIPKIKIKGGAFIGKNP